MYKTTNLHTFQKLPINFTHKKVKRDSAHLPGKRPTTDGWLFIYLFRIVPRPMFMKTHKQASCPWQANPHTTTTTTPKKRKAIHCTISTGAGDLRLSCGVNTQNNLRAKVSENAVFLVFVNQIYC